MDGALCASSCPLLFAGGVTRTAGDKAAIGLHQFYAPTGSSTAARAGHVRRRRSPPPAPISRHLGDMGVDAAIWLHALDTPPRQLYYLTRDEMARYRLVTSTPSLASR